MMHRRYRRFAASPSIRLATTYLAIIMLLSIGFSTVLYNISAQQLRRQIPPDNLFTVGSGREPLPQPQVNDFLSRRAEEGRNALRTRLIVLNIGALLLGSGISYYLARRSLRPIEAAMVAQSRFVGDASHELRTPLTAIQTSNEVALRNTDLTLEEAKTVITRNNLEVKKLKDLSDGLLNLAQQENGQLDLKPAALQDVATEAINQVLATALQKKIAINDQVAAVMVMAHFRSLTQVLVILLDNAIKYSPAKTTVTIATDVTAKSVRLWVADQGIGIASEDQKRIFDRFYRSDTARSNGQKNGYGLGLAIAQAIVERLDGTITVQSQIDKGSTFIVELRRP